MLTITVAQDGSGDFATVSEAVLAVPYGCAAQIRIGPGVYREKLVCEKQDITLTGAGPDRTRIVWNDGGKLPHPDGRPTHTFRSYTAFFSGESLRVEDLTIENDAGPGAAVALALAVLDAAKIGPFHKINALKTLIGTGANISASVVFIIQGAVDWPAAIMLCIGCFIGGYIAPSITRKIPANIMRAAAVIAGIILTIDLGLKTY